MIFDFILFNESSIGLGVFKFARDGILTVVLALISTGILGYLLHKTTYHINYVIILTFIVLIYSLAKSFHLPALLLILIFGLVLANNKFLEKEFIKRFIDFPKFRNDIGSFKKILGELTFLVRSFFFIMFGFYTQVFDLFNQENILTASIISLGIFLLRWLFFKIVLRLPAVPMVFFAPVRSDYNFAFLSSPLPVEISNSVISQAVVTLVILITILFMAIGNFLQKKEVHTPEEA